MNSAIPKHQPTSKEVAKLESEIQFLRRSLEVGNHLHYFQSLFDTFKYVTKKNSCHGYQLVLPKLLVV